MNRYALYLIAAMLLMLDGAQRTSAVAAGVITCAIQAVVASFSWFFLNERSNGRALISIALAVAGVVVINVAQGTCGIVFLGERRTITHGIALACVVTGIVLASMKAKTAPMMIS